ncbi:hypothetical protein CDL15_Pgr017433 [Punica granatum]|uniref:Uncharacterized protein n=1 Tax=Punica granatum TaxID=22663 RepID=A0A218WS46_PUNGR|nr:hypothetical protein CDL15_Pgr017433 [Punica granatum]
MKPKTLISIPFLGPVTAPISFPQDCSYLAWTCRDITPGIKTGVDPKETGMDPEEDRIDLKETRIDLNWKLKAGMDPRGQDRPELEIKSRDGPDEEFEIWNLRKALCDTARLAFGYGLLHARRLMMISYRSSFSEHRWFGRCGASLDDFQGFENTACHMRQTRIRRRGASPGVPDRTCTREREAYKGCQPREIV